MSVVVASHYTHNLTTGKKEVRFLSNVEVPLPSIQFSKIEKQLFGEVYIPNEHVQVTRKQLYKEVWETAAKLQASATKYFNARQRYKYIAYQLERRKEYKNLYFQSRAKRLSLHMEKIKQKSLGKNAVFRERRQRILEKNRHEYIAKLGESSKMIRTRILSTADQSPFKSSSPGKYLAAQRRTIAEIPTSNAKPKILINTAPTYSLMQHRRTSSDVKHNSGTVKNLKPVTRVSSTQSSQSIREKLSNAWDKQYNEVLVSAVNKVETIERARKLKEMAHYKTIKEAYFKRQQLQKLHYANMERNRQKQEYLVKKTLEKTSRCHSSSSAKSERTLSPHPRLTPSLSLPRLSCRPTYTKPIRQRLQNISLDFYRVVRNREYYLILKKS